jgi:hypothetical protein
LPFYVEKIPSPHIFTLKATLKICWLPRRCACSDKLLWLKKAYKVETEEYDYQDIYKVYTWVDRDTYMVKTLKGEL